MYPTTPTLSRLMSYYNILNLAHGAKEDKLGDVYEDYCVEILSSSDLLDKAKNNDLNLTNTDEYIFHSVFSKNIIPYIEKIYRISATRNIQHRITGGNPKTDIIIDIQTNDSTLQLPISIKQTTAPKVAMAEFDVNTIVKEIGITDHVLISLLEKHQQDASAKNFTPIEKQELFNRMIAYKHKFVRWVISGTPEPTNDLRYPDLLIKFSLTKSNQISNINCYTIDEYVNYLTINQHGKPKKGGFGTGLSWTYATRSKGEKIQFKG